MSQDRPPLEDLDPAEERLRDHLGVLLVEPPPADPSLPRAVVRTARWQRATRPPLHAVGRLAAAVVDAFTLLLGFGRRGRRS